jgi:hypothetical protein
VEKNLTRHQKFVVAEAIGRYDIPPTDIVDAIEGHVTLPVLREVMAFARQVAFNLRYVDPLDFNHRWTHWEFLNEEPDPNDEVSYRVRQLIGKKSNGKKIISWREVVTPYADRLAA